MCIGPRCRPLTCDKVESLCSESHDQGCCNGNCAHNVLTVVKTGASVDRMTAKRHAADAIQKLVAVNQHLIERQRCRLEVHEGALMTLLLRSWIALCQHLGRQHRAAAGCMAKGKDGTWHHEMQDRGNGPQAGVRTTSLQTGSPLTRGVDRCNQDFLQLQSRTLAHKSCNTVIYCQLAHCSPCIVQGSRVPKIGHCQKPATLHAQLKRVRHY